MHRALRLVVLAALALTSSGCWLSYGGNLANERAQTSETRISPATVGGLAERWRVDGVDGSTSTPAVFANIVYFGAWDGTLRAVQAATGAEVWTTQLTSSVIDDSPVIAGETVYVGDGTGNLHAVDRLTGAVRWTRDLDPHANTRIFSSPVVIDNRVIVGVASTELSLIKSNYTFRGSVVSLDAATGAVQWRVYTAADDATAGAGVSVWSSAAIDAERHLAYIGTGQSYEAPAGPLSDALLAIDYRTGTIEWVRQFTQGDVYTIFQPAPQGPDADIGAAPNLFTIGDREVVGVGDKAGVYAALDRDTGDTVWATRLPTGSHLGGIMTTAAYHDGALFLSSNQWANLIDFHAAGNTSTTFALDATTGDILWERDLPSTVFGAMTYANGVVFQPTIDGLVYALDASDGSILWSATPGADLGSGVTVNNGMVFVPYGFWFFAFPANPQGGLVAYALP